MLNINSLVKRPSTLGLIGVLLLLILGTANAQTSRVAGEVVLYTFEEGVGTTVYDISGVGTPLNLTIADESLKGKISDSDLDYLIRALHV